jgi:hypothetical protein
MTPSEKTFTAPALDSMMLSGWTSRWTTPVTMWGG